MGNSVLFAAVLSMVVAQVGKLFYQYFTHHKWDPSLLWSASGMPSSHSAAVASVATMVGLTEGFGSPLFAVATIFSLLVIYDAMGVRRAVGDQAELLNYLMELREHTGKHLLVERVGHTPPQVVTGIILGVLVSLGLYYV